MGDKYSRIKENYNNFNKCREDNFWCSYYFAECKRQIIESKGDQILYEMAYDRCKKVLDLCEKSSSTCKKTHEI